MEDKYAPSGENKNHKRNGRQPQLDDLTPKCAKYSHFPPLFPFQRAFEVLHDLSPSSPEDPGAPRRDI